MNRPADATGIDTLQPQLVWEFFAGMAAIPRCSKEEEKVCKHLVELAKQKGFSTRQDSVGNIVIEVPASPGCEKAPITVLQGHVDMVCEKNEGTAHDFSCDPIRLVLDKDEDGKQIVRADGTTLGADNAIGVAMGLAAACSSDVVHPPLEILCTIDEEAGMTGAKALEPGFIKGRRMLNLDSEEDDAIYIGCAGGCDTTLTWKFDTSSASNEAETCRITIKGLRGGHSGGDIHQNRGNANKILVHTLTCIDNDSMRLRTINGGSKRNAIAREASAVVSGQSGLIAALQEAAKRIEQEALREHSEPKLSIQVEAVTDSNEALSAKDTQNFLKALVALPHGVLAMNTSIPDLVQTSTNLGIIQTEPACSSGVTRVTVQHLSRSSSEAQVHATVRQITAVGMLAGAHVESGNDYPGWEPDVDSPTLATCRRVYEKLFNESANITAIHAGLECGIIGKRIGGMDMVSFGPTIEGAHSPDERVYTASVEKSWKYLVAVLAELAKP